MTVTSKWVALHEVSDYLAKGWREVKLEGGLRDAALMVSPEEPASEERSAEVCPNCGGIVEVNEPHRWRHPNAPDTYSCQKPASEPAKVECPNCLQKVPSELEHWHSGYHDDNCTVEPHYICEQQISDLDDRHNRMASPEYQAKVKADMSRRAVEIGVDRLVGITAFPVGNCPTCGELVAPWNKHAKYEGGYSCQPAQPESAAREMPEAKSEPNGQDTNRRHALEELDRPLDRLLERKIGVVVQDLGAAEGKSEVR